MSLPDSVVGFIPLYKRKEKLPAGASSCLTLSFDRLIIKKQKEESPHPPLQRGAKSPPALFKKREPIGVHLCPSVARLGANLGPTSRWWVWIAGVGKMC